MADNCRTRDAEAVEQRLGVARQDIKAVPDIRLRRFPKAELIRYDDAVPLAGQRGDGPSPVIAGKTLAVQNDDGLAIGGRARSDIHIGHAQQLVLDREVEETDRIGIVDTFEADAERLSAEDR